MKLTAKRVHLFCTEFNKITHLLKSAFPKKEQTSVFLLLLGTLRKNTHFTAFYDGDKFVGLLYTIENDKYYFILYLAVNPEMRSGGIGGEILDYAYAQTGKKSFLSMSSRWIPLRITTSKGSVESRFTQDTAFVKQDTAFRRTA